jgi:hypothetical protein
MSTAVQSKKTQRQELFLAALAQTGIKTQACEIAGITYRRVDRWREEEDFALLYDQAMEESCDTLESEARRRALGFQAKTVTVTTGDDGNVSVTEKTEQKVSDSLLMFLLKGRRPKVFQDRVSATHSGAIVSANLHRVSNLQDDELVGEILELAGESLTTDQLMGLIANSANPEPEPIHVEAESQ